MAADVAISSVDASMHIKCRRQDSGGMICGGGTFVVNGGWCFKQANGVFVWYFCRAVQTTKI